MDRRTFISLLLLCLAALAEKQPKDPKPKPTPPQPGPGTNTIYLTDRIVIGQYADYWRNCDIL